MKLIELNLKYVRDDLVDNDFFEAMKKLTEAVDGIDDLFITSCFYNESNEFYKNNYITEDVDETD